MKQGNLQDKLLSIVNDRDVPEWSEELEEESKGYELLVQGTQGYTRKNISITDMINPVKFIDLNSLQGYYPFWWSGLRDSPIVYKIGFAFLQLLFISGFIVSIGYSIRNKQWRIVPVIVITSWLVASTTGVDTKRYFLYLPVFMAFMYPLSFKLALQIFKPTKYRILTFFLVSLAFISAYYLVQGNWDQRDRVKEMGNHQAGTDSKGGIASVAGGGIVVREEYSGNG